MKIYAVIVYDDYYPRPNNIIKAFLKREDAEKLLNETRIKMRDYDNPESLFDNCRILEIEVEE